jgi:acetyl esterase/lipase
MRLEFHARLASILLATAVVLGAGTLAAGKGTDAPKPNRVLRNLEFSNVGGKSLLLDLYLPANVKGRAPVIIGIHGGGWMAGDKENPFAAGMGFLEHGYAVASISYRFSNEAIFPAQIIDCKAAVRWLRANARKYHLDPNHFGAWGHSAGGHLVAMLGVTDGVKEFDAGDNLDQSSSVQAVCWYAGVSDMSKMALIPGYEMWRSADSGVGRLIGGAVLENKEKADAASPIHYVSSHSAPFILFHGDKDELVPLDQAISMRYALSKVGVEAELHVLKGQGHGSPQFTTPETGKLVMAFFDKYLKPSSQ